MWLLDPDRTVEELDYFVANGRRPTQFIKMPRPEPPKVQDHSGVTFPSNPGVNQKYLDNSTGKYYNWDGFKWKILANTPLQRKADCSKAELTTFPILHQSSGDSWVEKVEREKYVEALAQIKRPIFVGQLEEKQWCAHKASQILSCEIEVLEQFGMGLVVINGREFQHSIQNWDWNNKTGEEFFDHLYHLYTLYQRQCQ